MEAVFKLSRRKGSAKWQVRKRWPTDVAAILPGEFNASTGEEERSKAQQQLVLIAAEYERRVAEARSKIASAPVTELTELQVRRIAAEFYRTGLPSSVVRRRVEPLEQQELVSFARSQAASARRLAGRLDFSPVMAAARTLVAREGVSLPDDSEGWDRVHSRLMQVFVALQEDRLAMLEGHQERVPTARSLWDFPDEPAASPERTIDDLLAAYEADKAAGWSGSSKKAVVPVFRVLRDVFGRRGVSSITREDARGIVELLQRLPTMPGKRRELDGLTMPQAADRARKLGLPTLSPKTINDGYLLHIASVFNWAVREQWIASSPFKALSVHDPVADEDRRDPFTAAQLQELFSLGCWVGPWEAARGRAGDYWVPLLCLFHGLRNGEAAGLRVEDVTIDEGIPLIHVRPYEGKGLKTEGSRGSIPVHPEMLALGFLAYVEGRRDDGEVLLFPEGTSNARGQVGAKLGERFSQKVKALGMTGRKLGMHSFRHNFEDRLRAAELPERTSLALARRTEPGSSRIYGEGVTARQKQAAMSKLHYPGIDLSHLRRGTE
ncbi:site-specific integrase [Novosphingobium sp. 11B]